MITIFKIENEGVKCIGIKKDLAQDIKSAVLKIADLRFSNEHDCYWLPHGETNFKRLRQLGELNVIDCGTAKPAKVHGNRTAIEEKSSTSVIPEDTDISATRQGVEVHWTGLYFTIKIPYKPAHLKIVKKLEKSYWNAKYKSWVAKSSLSNLKKIQLNFAVWNDAQYEKIANLISMKVNPKLLELWESPEFIGKMLIRLSGHNVDMSYIKGLAQRNYDSVLKRWVLPKSSRIVDGLIDYYSERGVKIINRLRKSDLTIYDPAGNGFMSRVEKLKAKYPAWMSEQISAYLDRLILQKYGWRTMVSYTGKYATFLEHFKDCDVRDLSVADVNGYLTELASKDISESLHNMFLSAIKFYYEKVCYREAFQLERLVRPRRGRYLPTILSIGEVDKLLRSITNLKHLAVAYAIYSGGMRLGEILSLRVVDIHWERNQVHVRSGKGNKDRFTLLGEALKGLLRMYFDEYQPQYWLFEGADKNGPYSERSVQNVIRTAARKAGIMRRVTPHTLRHCFATHLLDNGTDVRYIQELLGHKDIKTTLVYTHVTTHSLSQIESPLDKLMSTRNIKNRNI